MQRKSCLPWSTETQAFLTFLILLLFRNIFHLRDRHLQIEMWKEATLVFKIVVKIYGQSQFPQPFFWRRGAPSLWSAWIWVYFCLSDWESSARLRRVLGAELKEDKLVFKASFGILIINYSYKLKFILNEYVHTNTRSLSQPQLDSQYFPNHLFPSCKKTVGRTEMKARKQRAPASCCCFETSLPSLLDRGIQICSHGWCTPGHSSGRSWCIPLLLLLGCQQDR